MRVLVVAYYFPPIGGGGVNRTLKLVRGLVAAGDEPRVLTVDDAVWERDPSLLSEVPVGVPVLRVFNPDWGRVGSLLPRGTACDPSPASRSSAGRLRRWLVPDLHVGWSALATPLAAGLAACGAIDVVYTTAPPYSAHAAGWFAQRLGVPWVADFRDAWTDCPTRDDLPGWRVALERKLEAGVFHRADRVVFASDGARDRAVARCPSLEARSETILTGFDPADFPIESPPESGILEIVHAGNVLLHRRAGAFESFGRALRDALRSSPQLAERLRVSFVGGEPAIGERLAQLGLWRVARVERRVPRRDLPARLARAHAALVFGGDAERGGDPIPGKLFDAVGARRPVLAVAGEGALAQLIDRYELGVVIDPARPDRLAATLGSWRRGVAGGGALPGPTAAGRAALGAEVGATRLRSVLERVVRSEEERGTCPSPSAS